MAAKSETRNPKQIRIPVAIASLRPGQTVLKPGGRLAITDIVALMPVPESLRKGVELYTACGAGAALVEDVKAMLKATGFKDIRVELKAGSRELILELFPGRGLENYFASTTIEALKPDVT